MRESIRRAPASGGLMRTTSRRLELRGTLPAITARQAGGPAQHSQGLCVPTPSLCLTHPQPLRMECVWVYVCSVYEYGV